MIEYEEKKKELDKKRFKNFIIIIKKLTELKKKIFLVKQKLLLLLFQKLWMNFLPGLVFFPVKCVQGKANHIKELVKYLYNILELYRISIQ